MSLTRLGKFLVLLVRYFCFLAVTLSFFSHTSEKCSLIKDSLSGFFSFSFGVRVDVIERIYNFSFSLIDDGLFFLSPLLFLAPAGLGI